jgi:hypothetical protein
MQQDNDNEDTDLDYITIIYQIQFQNQQLNYKIQELNKNLKNKSEIIKMLEYTISENRDWTGSESIDKPDNAIDECIQEITDVPETTVDEIDVVDILHEPISIEYIEEKKNEILAHHNMIIHLNKTLIKKGLYKNNKLAYKIMSTVKNIIIK